MQADLDIHINNNKKKLYKTMCIIYMRIKKKNRKQNLEGKKDKLCQISNIWFPL